MLRTRSHSSTLIALVIAACMPAQVGSRYVKSEKVNAAQGSTLSVAPSESGALQGTQLQIAAGALAQDTTISLEVGMSDLVPVASAAGPVAVWEPSGLHFLTPVKMTLPFRLREGQRVDDLNILVQESDGIRQRIAHRDLSIDLAAGRVTFAVNGFTGFQPNVGGACTTDSDCASGEVCASGACQPRGGTGGGSSGAGGGSSGAGGGSSGAGGGNPQCTPSAEVCDGADNNCDGIVDNGATCAAGQVCASGACVAATSCSTVRDCDPATEDCVGGYCVPINSGAGGGSSGAGGGSSGTGGGSAGTGGGGGTCTPTTEVCDGIDNDCDGTIDNAATCSGGQTCWGGACTTIACDPVRGCPSGLSCINGTCQ